MSRLIPERVALAREIMGRYPVSRSALIPLIHLAQEQDGYVADDAMEHIAELIGCTPAEVYGTGSFYEMFKFRPVGKYVLGVCTNISCLLQGAEGLLSHVEATLDVGTGATTADGMFTLEDVECIAACTLAPCLQVNYRYFPNVTPESFDQLVADLRSGALAELVPPHGTLARVRQHVGPGRWAGSAAAPPRLPDAYPGPALAGHAQPTAPSQPTAGDAVTTGGQGATAGGQGGADASDPAVTEAPSVDPDLLEHGAGMAEAVRAEPGAATGAGEPGPETGTGRTPSDRPRPPDGPPRGAGPPDSDPPRPAPEGG